MNIKEHIEAGHYPTDDKGFPLVKSDAGDAHIVSTSGPRPEYVILGFRSGSGCCGWDENGRPHMGILEGAALKAPPPRKVKVTRFIQINPANGGHTRAELHPSELPFNHADGWVCVELTGEYEQPW